MEHLIFLNNRSVRNFEIEIDRWCFFVRVDNEYRLIIDKKDERCSSENVERFAKEFVENIQLERQSVGEMIFGIRRNQSKHVERLIESLDEKKESLGIKSYGLTMTSIEDVFLKSVIEESNKSC